MRFSQRPPFFGSGRRSRDSASEPGSVTLRAMVGGRLAKPASAGVNTSVGADLDIDRRQWSRGRARDHGRSVRRIEQGAVTGARQQSLARVVADLGTGGGGGRAAG